jgi:hypothetical protein
VTNVEEKYKIGLYVMRWNAYTIVNLSRIINVLSLITSFIAKDGIPYMHLSFLRLVLVFASSD